MSVLDNTQELRIDVNAFSMPSSDGGSALAFWTSSLLAGDDSHAWVVDFGASTNLLVTAALQSVPGLPQSTSYVRCVRGPT
jgi:hypothetical protein